MYSIDSIDLDAIPNDTGNAMKDLFDRLEKENKIKINKYHRPMHVRKLFAKTAMKVKRQKRSHVDQRTKFKGKSNFNATISSNASNIVMNTTTNNEKGENDANERNLQNVGASNARSVKFDSIKVAGMKKCLQSTTEYIFSTL